MNYYDLIEDLAKQGIDKFKYELNTNPIYKGLLWTVMDETDEYVSIDIETFDDETLDSEFLMTVEFDQSGNWINK